MAKHSKRFEFLFKKVEGMAAVDVATAVKTLKSLEPSLPSNIKPVKFDQTVQLAVQLGIDPKQDDQAVRGSIVLPHGIGKSKRVLVFAQGNNADLAKAAGAQHVGGKDLADKIKELLRHRVGDTLTCSIGLAPNRFLAKIASDLDKPRGFAVIGAAESAARLPASPF